MIINDKELAASIDWSVPISSQELEQMRWESRLSLWETLGWLEEAQRFVEQMAKQGAMRPKDPKDKMSPL